MAESSETERPWHGMSAADALGALQAGPDGLDAAEAEARLARFGPNRLEQAQGRGPLARLLAQFDNVLLYVLMGSAVVTALLGAWLDTAVIVGVVVINAVVGFIQEGKAEQALAAIRTMLLPRATVRRAGERLEIDAADIVPGDIVLLRAGDRVPADLRLIEAHGLEIEEAILTGEAEPVTKRTAPDREDAVLAERRSLAHAGTLVRGGTGAGVAIATGARTELGRITTLVAGVERPMTPLLRHIATFSTQLTFAILGASVLLLLFGLFGQDMPIADAFLAVVGFAVAAIPEGLPPVITISLAIGVTRMARRHAIVRRLPAIETLGSVSVICADKTGTLTRNELMICSLVTAAGTATVDGVGYRPEGAVRRDGRPVRAGEDALLDRLVAAALAASDGALHETPAGWQAVGSATDAAILRLSTKYGNDACREELHRTRCDTIPFSTELRLMATLHEEGVGNVAFVKGAPEKLLSMCKDQLGEDGPMPLDEAFWQDRIAEMTGRAERVLAVAMVRMPREVRQLTPEGLGRGMILLGLLGLIDPPREEAIRAVASCHAAGIEVKMITGDHPRTAAAIGAAVGLRDADRVVTGRELDAMDADALKEACRNCNVFARTTPSHKLRLVEALQADGGTVAMTGDGVNDAPALKRADIGIAMGARGTEAAKEASGMVLADDNFASIEAAVREGRTVYENIRKTILLIVPTSGAEAMTVMLAILFGTALPILPAQILWVNMITAVTLGLALAFEPAEADIMERPPRPRTQSLLSRFLVWRVVFVSLVLVVGVYGLFLLALNDGASLERARTMAVNGLIFGEAAYLLNCRHVLRPALERSLFTAAPWIWLMIGVTVVVQIGWTHLPPVQALFRSESLTPGDWTMVIAFAALLFVVVEIEKHFARRRKAGG